MNESCPDRFQRIPHNILRRVFELAAGESPIILPMQNSRNIQCTVLGVCKKWKMVAVGTSSIWVSITFELDNDLGHPRITAKLLQQFSIFLKRSQNRPLSIIFSPTSIGLGFRGVNKALRLCYSRIQSLTCMLSSRRDMDAFLSLPPANFPELRYIRIGFVTDIIDAEHTSTQNYPTGVFVGAFRLETAILHHIPGLNHVKLRLCWTALKHLDFGGTPMHPHTFIRIMKYTAPTLKTAFISVELKGSLDASLAEMSNPLPLPNLTTLRLRLQYPNRDWRILSLLHLPSLITLRIEIFDVLQIWSIPHVAKFLQPSGESLQHLCLSDFEPSGRPLVLIHQETVNTLLFGLFSLIPNVNTLRLPLSIPVHATTIENIASGKILRSLSTMEISYPNIWHGLALVRHRGNLERMTLRGQGRSTVEESGVSAVSAFDSQSLWVPSCQIKMEDIFSINAEKRRLISEGLISHIYIHPTADLPLPIGG